MIDPVLVRLVLVALGIALVAAVGWWWTRRDGRVRDAGGDVHVAADHLADVGLDVGGARAGAVLLGSPTCSSCAAVEQLLGDLAADRDDFRWVKVDAADHLDLAQAHRVLRVPTLLVVDADRRLLARTAGVPARDDLAALLDGRPASDGSTGGNDAA